jgi:propionyl-CoA carboxylase alpha chain
MNARIQVEHPVTEAVLAVDLVALQLAAADPSPESQADRRVAQGGTARQAQDATGHAVEVRLYAEDPGHGWQPQSGRLDRFEIDCNARFERSAGYGVRVDAGFGTGDEVGTHYDAMLAKVIAWAPTRSEALHRLAGALRRAEIHGIRTNRDLLVEILRHDGFVAGDVSTDFLDRHDLAATRPAPVGADLLVQSAFAAAVTLAERARANAPVQRHVPAGWRNVVSAPQRTEFTETTVRWLPSRDGYTSGLLRAEMSGGDVVIASSAPDKSAVRRAFRVHVYDGRVDVESSLGHVAHTPVPRFTDPADQVASGSLLAPMPGSVVRIAVEPGRTVAAGEPVLVLEAMKMQHTITAPHAGTVTDLPVSVGSQVTAGEVLAVVQQEPDVQEETHD